MREIEDQLARGIWIPEKKIPLFESVASDWLTSKRPNVRASTWAMYEGHLKHHFGDINEIRVNLITPAKVEKFITAKLEAGMNITTLRKILVTFNQVMNYAVRHKYIDHNPVRDAERPKGQGAAKKPKIRVLSASEIQIMLNGVENPKYRMLFRLAIFSGARQGDLLGLKWTDIDWINSQIHIQRTYNKKSWYKPKTETSNRRIDIGPSTMKALKEWRVACPPNDLDLVFPSQKGAPLAEAPMVRRYFKPALKKAGISPTRFHDLRHTYASLLIEQGENIKYIQNQLGHSNPTKTLNIYAHLMKPVNQEAACRLENTIFSTTGSKPVAEMKKGATPGSVTP